MITLPPERTVPLTAQRPRRRWTARHAEALAGYLFILPNALGFLLLTLLPVGASLLLSFYDWNLLESPRFVGLDNFRMLLKDKVFVQVVRNTVYYVVGTVPFTIFVAMIFAVLLNRRLRGMAFFRGAFFLPVVTATVAISLVWKWMYRPEGGVINTLLHLVGIHGPRWLGDPKWAMPAMILMSIWKGFGYYTVIYLAGLQNISRSVYEAAQVDGASPWHQFWRITVPLLSPVTFFVAVIAVINSFQIFDQALVMTEGGPANATNTLVLYIYQNGFQWFKMGYASAIAWVLFGCVFIFTLIQVRAQRRWVHYD